MVIAKEYFGKKKTALSLHKNAAHYLYLLQKSYVYMSRRLNAGSVIFLIKKSHFSSHKEVWNKKINARRATLI